MSFCGISTETLTFIPALMASTLPEELPEEPSEFDGQAFGVGSSETASNQGSKLTLRLDPVQATVSLIPAWTRGLVVMLDASPSPPRPSHW
ncbi:MAG: hypothetical protein JRN04_03770 [Nitrososphaerota archaeon]|nr:hypothetical protein [Nitrososphaerota archaeon]